MSVTPTAAQLILAARQDRLSDVAGIRPKVLAEALAVAREVLGPAHAATKRLAAHKPALPPPPPRRYKVQRPRSTRSVGGHIILKTAHLGLDVEHVDVYAVDGALVVLPAAPGDTPPARAVRVAVEDT